MEHGNNLQPAHYVVAQHLYLVRIRLHNMFSGILIKILDSINLATVFLYSEELDFTSIN